MTAVPSSAIRSWPAPLVWMWEGVRVGGDLAPLSHPLTRPLGTFRSSGSSKDSMTACDPEPVTCTDRHREQFRWELWNIHTDPVALEQWAFITPPWLSCWKDEFRSSCLKGPEPFHNLMVVIQMERLCCGFQHLFTDRGTFLNVVLFRVFHYNILLLLTILN